MAYLKVELTGTCRVQLPDTVDEKERSAIINTVLDKVCAAWDTLRSDPEFSHVQTLLKFDVIEQAAMHNFELEEP